MKTRAPVVETYRKLAPEYDTRWAFYVEATIQETLARFRVAADAKVLDVGCGTGALLRQLHERDPAATLAGIDPVVEMLEIARKRLPSRTALCASWAESLPFASSRFDAVVCTNMLHYVQRPKAALAEMRRVLRPGGRLILTDWCDDYVACRLCNLWLRAMDPAHVRVYRSVELQQLLTAAGFRTISLDRYKITWFWGLMTAVAE